MTDKELKERVDAIYFKLWEIASAKDGLLMAHEEDKTSDYPVGCIDHPGVRGPEDDTEARAEWILYTLKDVYESARDVFIERNLLNSDETQKKHEKKHGKI